MNKEQLKSLINEVMQDMAKESLKNKLKKLISEEIQERHAVEVQVYNE